MTLKACPKLKVFRSKKILAAARGEACVNCGIQDDTVVAAHYSGINAAMPGKGTGIKGHDFAVAFFCKKCHDNFDNRVKDKDYEFLDESHRSMMFLLLILKTQARLFEKGILVVK